MANTIKLHMLESLRDMYAETWPNIVDVPYVQLNSERFICKETNEVWHRFSDLSIFSENTKHPDAELNEHVETLPDGLVGWSGKNGSVPKAGDRFEVLDSQDNIIFEEVISGASRLFGHNFVTAQKEAPFANECIVAMYQAILDALAVLPFKPFLDPDPNLFAFSPKEPASVETVSTDVRGIPFNVSVQEFVSQRDCELMEYKDGDFSYRPFAAGGHWFEVIYSTEKDPSFARSIGWGEGTAKEVALKISKALCKEQSKSSLDFQIQSASSRASDAQASTEMSKEKREEHERN